MKNRTSKNLIKSSFLLLGLCIVYTMTFTACSSSKESKADVLQSASKLNPAFANMIIESNSISGFADDNKGQKDSLILIADALKEHKYDNVIKLSNEFFNKYTIDNNVKYMLATALFQKGEYGKAAKHYIPLLNATDFEEKRMAKYYLALCNMRFDSESGTKTAIKYLKQLKNDPGEEFSPDQIQGLIDVCS